MTISVKDPAVLSSILLHRFHPALVEIIGYVAGKYGILITEGYRLARHPNDVHATDPVRAVDLRYRLYEQKQAYEIMDDINNRWAYDPKRETMVVAIIHGDGDNKHFHVQVHPNTVRRQR
jgi:hypothetical protein